RQGRPGRARRRRPADPAGEGAHHRRHGGMSGQLLDIARRVADQATAGEQVEAFVAREREASVRVYEGEVEHLTSAQVDGMGVRVIKAGRVGVACAGPLDDDSVAEVLAEARDNVAFGTPDEWAGLAEPDGVAPADVDLWREEMASFSTESKVALAT